MKLTPATVLHWFVMFLALVVSIATIVAGGPDAKLAGYAATTLAIAGMIKKIVDAEDTKAAVATAVNTVVPVVQAATAGNPVQAAAVNTAVAVVKAIIPEVAPPPVASAAHLVEDK